MKKTEYKVVVEVSASTLEATVNKWLLECWEVHGSMVINHVSGRFYQTLVRVGNFK